jgi:prephenate dehydrogenase
MHVAFIGFGLIAGSIARAVRSNPETGSWTMAAWSPSGTGPRQALAERVIDVAATEPRRCLADADVVVLGGPATACLASLDALAAEWRDDLSLQAVVTDVASTKAMLVGRADAGRVRYVGGHPMAGLDASGYLAGSADLFVGRPWVVVPGAIAEAPDIDRVTQLAGACRARAVRMDATTHDRAVAAISHLPLVVAAALVESVVNGAEAGSDLWPVASSLAAGGWRDATRVARGDAAMGAAIAVTNPAELSARLRDLRTVIDTWLADLDRPGGPSETMIRDRLAAARAALEAADGR